MIQIENELLLMCNFLINTGHSLQYSRDQPLRFILVILTSPVESALNLKIYMAFLIHFSQKLILMVKITFRKHVFIKYKGTLTSLVKNHS